MNTYRPYAFLLLSLPLAFLLLFYFYPLFKINLYSFLPDGHWNIDHLAKLLDSPVYVRTLWFTFWQAALSTLLTLVLAIPGAFIFAHYNFRGKELLQAIMTVPFVLPTVVTAAAFRALLGSGGIINQGLMELFSLPKPPLHLDQTIPFFLLAHIFYNYTLVVRIVSSFWSGLDNSLMESSTMLGASPWKTFIHITLPQLLPAIGSAAMLVFIFCFTSFGVILILGGPGLATLEVEIYRQTVQLFNLPLAATLSLIQIITNFLLMWLYSRLTAKSKVSFYGETASRSNSLTKTSKEKLFILINISFMVVFLLSPLTALVIQSITGQNGFTLSFYQALFTTGSKSIFYVEPIKAVANSIFFACIAMISACILGLLAATYLSIPKKRLSSIMDACIMLPLATSAVTLGFGFIIALNKPPLNLRDSLLIIPIAHTLVAFPFVLRSVLPSLRQIPQNLREAASLLGASPFLVWKNVDLPLIRKSLLVGAVFGFIISMGEFGASVFVVRPHTPTMPVAIFRFLSQPGTLNYGQAMAMSSILMMVSFLSFFLLGWLGKTSTPPFSVEKTNI